MKNHTYIVDPARDAGHVSVVVAALCGAASLEWVCRRMFLTLRLHGVPHGRGGKPATVHL
jgi:phosphoenolpyruvate carboxylase